LTGEIHEAMRDARNRLKAMGDRPVYRGIPSRGSAGAILRVEGAVARVGFDEEGRRAAFYSQPQGELP